MLWIALHLPRLPFEALAALAVGDAPAAVVERQVVCLTNAAAAAQGVAPGMGLATACSRCVGLRVAERDPSAEAALVEQLALVALRYTPRVCLRPDGLALEVQASLRLFGGERRLWDRLEADIRPWGLKAGWAAAPTREAACLLAMADARRRLAPQGPHRSSGRALHPVPLRTRRQDRCHAWLDALPLPMVLQAWATPAAVQSLLHGLGLRTLGELRRMPRDGLSRRSGAELLLRMDCAYGLSAEAVAFHEPPPHFIQGLEMPEHTDQLEPILMVLERLMIALGGWLAAHRRAAAVLSVRMRHDGTRREVHPDTVLTCQLTAAETRPSALWALFREHLQRQELAAPVRHLTLELQSHTEVECRNESLKWAHTEAEGPSSEEGSDAPLRVLDQLRARLGPERILILQACGDHRPERASRWSPVSGEPTPPRHEGALDEGLPRPCWLLNPPQALTERRGQLWRGPQRFVLQSRPERIEAGWFDDDPTCRDYHTARAPDGRLAWVYRSLQSGEPAWYLHGWFG